MPDTHAGAGCVIGFTADLGNKVIPNLVGVDIGCGMNVIKLGQIDIDLQNLDSIIHENIPAGHNIHSSRKVKFSKLSDLICYRELRSEKFEQAIGTLGGGNHFIELNVDDEYNHYLVIHSGSRNLGKQVAEYYQKMAINSLKGLGEYNPRKIELVNQLNIPYLAKVLAEKKLPFRQVTGLMKEAIIQHKFWQFYQKLEYHQVGEHWYGCQNHQ
jgi:RNA-splicing ligase RtcB